MTVKAEYKNCSIGLRDLFVNINKVFYLFCDENNWEEKQNRKWYFHRINIILMIFI